jgi:ISXO2-like transposase domain/Transposase zinc-ribbon domain
MKEPKTLRQAIIYFSNADNCLEYMVSRTWPNGIVCPVCKRAEPTFLKNQRKWQCKSVHAKRQFSAKTGTIFEDSPISLEKWLPTMWLVTNCKNGISSYEVARAMGVTQKTAWFMLHRIRLAMKSDSTFKLGFQGGPVEMDETFIGGKLKNMHKSKRPKGTGFSGRPVSAMAKTIVVGMLERKGRVRAEVVAERTNAALMAVANKHIHPGATLVTDEWGGYKGNNFEHAIINHAVEYVRGQVHTQGIENFWALLKRSLGGTYIAVEPFHLDSYVDEQIFRYNNRATKDNPLTDLDRFTLAASQVSGKRLTYAELTGKVGAATF